MNLLKETIDRLTENGLTSDDVLWVGGNNVYSTWENFEEVANADYNSGYGGQEVARDLIIVGRDWWLERLERDDREWWTLKSYPKIPPNRVELTCDIIGGMWKSIEESKAYRVLPNNDAG